MIGVEYPSDQNFVTLGISSIVNNIKHIRKLPETFRLIIAFWIYGDGMSTVAFGTWFMASQSLGMSGALLGSAVLVALVAALAGNYFWWYLTQNYPFWKPKTIIITNICLSCLVPLCKLLHLHSFTFAKGDLL
jgi:MFS-type transporter involved in bile tolerance (Atg22 family)